ncbi:MAG: hypothetical protein ACRD1B_06120, partial [Thermoanaerobaculia bacterium]
VALAVTIAKRVAFQIVRVKKDEEQRSDDRVDPDTIGDSRWARQKAIMKIWSIFEALSHMAPKCVPTLQLQLEGYSLKEIAKQRGVGYAAVRKHWERCRSRVVDLFGSSGDAGADWFSELG